MFQFVLEGKQKVVSHLLDGLFFGEFVHGNHKFSGLGAARDNAAHKLREHAALVQAAADG